MSFADGKVPPKELLSKWQQIVDDFFNQNKLPEEDKNEMIEKRDPKKSTSEKKSSKATEGNEEKDIRRIGVHCVAGLGRAPFLVAIALVNNGCSPINAINLIRKNRPGVFNYT